MLSSPPLMVLSLLLLPSLLFVGLSALRARGTVRRVATSSPETLLRDPK